jgi:hypothetical protein
MSEKTESAKPRVGAILIIFAILAAITLGVVVLIPIGARSCSYGARTRYSIL